MDTPNLKQLSEMWKNLPDNEKDLKNPEYNFFF